MAGPSCQLGGHLRQCRTHPPPCLSRACPALQVTDFGIARIVEDATHSGSSMAAMNPVSLSRCIRNTGTAAVRTPAASAWLRFLLASGCSSDWQQLPLAMLLLPPGCYSCWPVAVAVTGSSCRWRCSRFLAFCVGGS